MTEMAVLTKCTLAWVTVHKWGTQNSTAHRQLSRLEGVLPGSSAGLKESAAILTANMDWRIEQPSKSGQLQGLPEAVELFTSPSFIFSQIILSLTPPFNLTLRILRSFPPRWKVLISKETTGVQVLLCKKYGFFFCRNDKMQSLIRKNYLFPSL